MVDVPVDDRDALDPELRLRVARRDRGVSEDAEPHRPVPERVVAGRADQREAADLDRTDRASGREKPGFPGGGLRERVAIEPRLLLERRDPVDVLRLVRAFDRLATGRGAFLLGVEGGQEAEEPFLALGMMVMAGPVQMRHRRMADGLDAQTSRSRRARRSTPSASAATAPASQSGSVRERRKRCGWVEGCDLEEDPELSCSASNRPAVSIASRLG